MSDPSPTTSPSKRGHNRAPQSDRLELDELGLAGVRMRLDALLASVHGIDDEQLARSGLDMAQLAAHRDAFVTMMTGIVLDERADAGANTRLLAIRLLGHLRLVEAADALVEVLRSHHERPTARIAAA